MRGFWQSTSFGRAENEAAHDVAFNIVNGDVFRWRWLWPRLAEWFGVEPAGWDGTMRPLEHQMQNDGPVWRKMAATHALAEPELGQLASPWHTDLDLGRPLEVM